MRELSHVSMAVDEKENDSIEIQRMQSRTDSILFKRLSLDDEEEAKLSDFEIIRMLGKGTFGKVFLV